MGQQPPYSDQPHQYPEQPLQPHYGDWNNGQQADSGQAQHQYQHQDGHGHQPYAGQGQQQYAEQQHHYQGGWDTGTQQHNQILYHTDPVDPYGVPNVGYGGEQPDLYGTPEAYPPPEPPARRRSEPGPQQTGDPGPDQGEHASFSGGEDGEDASDDPDGAAGRGDRRGKDGRKKRSGIAGLAVVLVLGGGVGYQFYQSRFAAPPDYVGQGTNDTVTVVIGKGASGYVIGQELKAKGVVKSVDGFVTAQANNPQGHNIQPGVYVLKRRMSAQSALELLLNPKSRDNLVIAEGRRNAQIYELIDRRLDVTAGTTAAVAQKEWKTLGLPDWANGKDTKDPLEGFLYPSSYPVSKGMKPEDVLKEMVELAKTKYEVLDLEDKAEQLGLDSPLQVLTVASLVQAEGSSKDDFEKVARVVYNRLDPANRETYGLLDFDSTVNYLRGESKLGIGSVYQLRQLDDPYNTYKIKGLPPGPINNPGDVAIKAALKPAKGDWYYFVSVGDRTLFAVTNEEHNRNRQQYLAEQNGQ